MRSNLIDVCCTLQHRTDRAVLVDHGTGEPVWLPLSQIEIEPNPDGKTVVVTLPEFLAVEKEMV